MARIFRTAGSLCKCSILLAVVACVGCALTLSGDSTVDEPGFFGFLVELAALEGNKEYPEGEVHPAIVIVVGNDPARAAEEMAEAVADGGWEVVEVHKVSEERSEVSQLVGNELGLGLDGDETDGVPVAVIVFSGSEGDEVRDQVVDRQSGGPRKPEKLPEALLRP